MCLRVVVGTLVLVTVAQVSCARDFPPGFQFGAATAAYQVEGAWNVSDAERYCTGSENEDGGWSSSPCPRDSSCEPVELSQRPSPPGEAVPEDSVSPVHVSRPVRSTRSQPPKRFSISWPRLLPSGFSNRISEDGRRYYSALIAGLRARGVAPVVTLYHWDLPQRLQDLGGWTNPLITDWFADYARVVFTLFADQAKTWITINEPGSVCDIAYRGFLAPGIKDHEFGALLCTKHVLLAHAKAYKIFKEEFKPKYGGEVSIASQESWFEPKTDHDLEITLLAREYMFGRYTHPIFSSAGGWPPTLERYMAEKSKREGYPRSRLPAFTAEEIQLVKGSCDFYGLNHYTSRTVRAATPDEKNLVYIAQGIEEVNAVLESRAHWKTATSSWLKVNPEGLRNLLKLIKQQYGDVKVIITENGYSDTGGDLNDEARVQYYKDYLEQVYLAITEDKVNVAGYTAWSLFDNFEWIAGYTSRFGLYAVDFSDPSRERVARASARYYRRVVRARSLDLASSNHTDTNATIYS